ncbi:hypothetical protein GW916_00295 [bacterium]|nr:hypothetical protein [bacterium]
MNSISKPNATDHHKPSSSDTPHRLGEQIENFSQRMGNQIGTAVSGASDRAASYTKGARSYVESHPVRSMAAATATGLVIGSLLTLVARRRS